jgi:outer membrane lipoprotein-sorting protein
MNRTRTLRAGVTLATIALVVAQATAQPDAGVILQRARKALTGLTSYQARWVMNMTSNVGSLTMNMDMKVIPAQGKLAMTMSPAGKATGQMAMASMMLQMQMVDDGKTAFFYMPMMGGYQKGPHMKKKMMMGPGEMAFQSTEDASFSYLRTDTVDGRPVHVIQVFPKKMEQNSKGDVLLFVDQATNRLKRMTMNMGGMPGPQGQAQSMKMRLEVTKEIVNAPIPSSAFKFVPPPGAKQIQGAMPKMGFPGLTPGRS